MGSTLARYVENKWAFGFMRTRRSKNIGSLSELNTLKGDDIIFVSPYKPYKQL